MDLFSIILFIFVFSPMFYYKQAMWLFILIFLLMVFYQINYKKHKENPIFSSSIQDKKGLTIFIFVVSILSFLLPHNFDISTNADFTIFSLMHFWIMLVTSCIAIFHFIKLILVKRKIKKNI